MHQLYARGDKSWVVDCEGEQRLRVSANASKLEAVLAHKAGEAAMRRDADAVAVGYEALAQRDVRLDVAARADKEDDDLARQWGRETARACSGGQCSQSGAPENEEAPDSGALVEASSSPDSEGRSRWMRPSSSTSAMPCVVRLAVPSSAVACIVRAGRAAADERRERPQNRRWDLIRAVACVGPPARRAWTVSGGRTTGRQRVETARFVGQVASPPFRPIPALQRSRARGQSVFVDLSTRERDLRT